MPTAATASGATQSLIEIHRQWILDVCKIVELTPTQIAKQVGLSPTTLTRLVNVPDHPHALSSVTIDKIVRKFSSFGVVPPVAPDFGAFREAVAAAVIALHRQSALQAGNPEQVANTILDLADWLIKAEGQSPEQFAAVASFEAERLKRQRST